MGTWLKRALLGAAIFTLCWAGAVWYWRSNNTMPGTGDLALYLLVLPLVLLFLVWFAKKLVLLVAAAPAASAAGAQAASTSSADQQPTAPQAVPVVDLLAGALRLPHGQSPQELREAVADSAARPDLDSELTDDHGFPLMTARVAGLDVAATEEALSAWLEQKGLPDPGFDTEQLRALALGGEVVAELAQTATLHQNLFGYETATPAARAAMALPVLQLLPMLPADWELGQRLAAGRWLLHLVEQQGWPAERLALSAAAERGGASPLSLIGQLSQQSAREELPCLAILLACASHLGDNTVEQWAGEGALFTARNQRGQIPGEGAAGLLLADATQAALIDTAAAPQLRGAVQAVRDNSADTGRTDAVLLTGLCQEALAGAGSEAAKVLLIASDTDHRGSRTAEMMSAAAAVLPHLDPATQVVAVSATCGQAGPVGAVAALVLARQEVADNASHALYLSNQDPYQRSAAIVRPKPEPASTPKPPAA
jgi:hypothetical protein